jgi:ubiquinone/menaquinone biosynthesis C-methylase UbiE
LSWFTDRSRLLSEQYQNDSNLSARKNLHERFSTNKYGWHKWVFDQLSVSAESRILELGCGPAWFWAENLDRIPGSWDIVLSDFSPGMISAARSRLADGAKRYMFGVIDAQALPFERDRFDVVMAHHMLYHVLERGRAIAEIRRVLKDGGTFYAATNGESHLREINPLKTWARQNLGSAAERAFQVGDNPFTLENGEEQLKPYFREVRIRRYDDALRVTEAAPLLSFIMSMVSTSRNVLSTDDLERFREYLERKVAKEGAIMISKDSGIFLSR